MPELSTRPYLIRAIFDWCTDCGFTPYIAVAVDAGVVVPLEFVKNGEIVLNVSPLATNRLKIDNEAVQFQARFSGLSREVYVPIDRVIAVYARENGQGMAFEVPRALVPAAIDLPDRALPAPPPRLVEAPRDRATLVPLVSMPAAAPTTSTDDPPPTPRVGERPHLTRIK